MSYYVSYTVSLFLLFTIFYIIFIYSKKLIKILFIYTYSYTFIIFIILYFLLQRKYKIQNNIYNKKISNILYKKI